MRDLWLRFRAIFFKQRVEQDLDDELAFHLEMETRKHMQAGMGEAEARRRARREFGRDSAVKEDCRDARRIPVIESLRQDVRYAFRGFRRTPTFALAVVATIGLGIGINTAVFTIFNSYVLRPLEVQDPSSLFEVSWLTRAGKEHQFSWKQFEQLQAGNPAFAEMHAVRGLPVRVNGSQHVAELVTGNYFRMLGARAQLGRILTPEDTAVPGSQPVVVLSASFWRKSLNADPNIVGRQIRLRGYPFEVIGVARDGFTGLGDPPRDFWVPLTMYAQLAEGPDLFGPQSPEVHYVIARLRPGISEPQAQSLMNSWIRRLTPDAADDQQAFAIRLQPRGTRVHLNKDAWLTVLPIFVAFGLILVIACANVANMMLARAMARQREIGIRLSLGAGRPRLIAQLLTESVALALPGAVAGFLISQLLIAGGVRLIFATVPAEFLEFLRFAPLEPDYRVFLFMLGAAILSGLLFGLAPALQATKASVVQAARGDFGHDFRPQRLRNTLVIVQIAVSALLLICSGVLLKGSNRIHTMDTGFETYRVVWIELFEKSRARILAELARQPDVVTLSATRTVPLANGYPSAFVSRDAAHTSPVTTSYNDVSAEFFDVVGVPIERGRTFTREESAARAPVAIVSASLAKRLWPDREAIGQSLQLQPDARSHLGDSNPLRFPVALVIGVARDVNTGFLEDQDSRLLLYFPTNLQAPGTALLMKVSGDPEQARQQIDKQLASAAPGGVTSIYRLEALVTGRSYPFRMASVVASMLGTLALLLTITGIYGVISYLVEQRQREMGIRMALGASARAVVGLILRQSLRMSAIGVVIGGALALAASRLLGSVMVMLSGFDAAAFLIAIAAVLAACLSAALFPSLRAARVDPADTLRHD